MVKLVDQIKEEEVIKDDSWLIRRYARVTEVELVTGQVRFRVQVWDEGRTPFITQWFNDIAPAADFLDHLKDQAEEVRR